MKHSNKNINNIKGTVLILVISIIGFMGVVMLFLSTASNTMNFQTNKVYLQACERNLISSGLNWAKTNLKNETITDFNDTIILDVNDMNILRSSLEIKVNPSSDDQNEVRIRTSCGRAKLNIKTSETFKL